MLRVRIAVPLCPSASDHDFTTEHAVDLKLLPVKLLHKGTHSWLEAVLAVRVSGLAC